MNRHGSVGYRTSRLELGWFCSCRIHRRGWRMLRRKELTRQRTGKEHLRSKIDKILLFCLTTFILKRFSWLSWLRMELLDVRCWAVNWWCLNKLIDFIYWNRFYLKCMKLSHSQFHFILHKLPFFWSDLRTFAFVPCNFWVLGTTTFCDDARARETRVGHEFKGEKRCIFKRKVTMKNS